MDKDFGIKNLPQYNSRHLRRRIAAAVKRPCDSGGESKRPRGKQYLLIPITGASGKQKFVENKTLMKF